MMEELRFNEIVSEILKNGDEHVDCSSLNLDDKKFEVLLSALQQSPVAIKSMNASKNNITSDGISLLVAFMQNTVVEEVYLGDNKIDDTGMAALLTLFTKETHPRAMDVHGNPCSGHFVTRLNFIPKCADYDVSVRNAVLYGSAEHVSFEGFPYTDLDNRAVQYILTEVQGLKAVSFARCGTGDSGARTVGQFLKDSQVESVDLADNKITKSGVVYFVEASNLPHHKYMRSINFRGNMNITSELAKQIPTMVFNTNCLLTCFDVNETSVSPDLVRSIEEECELNKQPIALKKAVILVRMNESHVTDLSLQWEEGMSQCMRFLWRVLRQNTTLERLNVSNALIGDEAMEELERALRENVTLRIIELANNRITVKGIATLFGALEKGQGGLQEVNLASNNLCDDATGPIISALRANPNLKVVNLDNNPGISQEYIAEIGGLALINRSPPVMRTLLPALESNSTGITEVDFSKKDVCYNDEAVRLLCQALLFNKTVCRLNLSNNVISDIGASYIAEMLISNGTVTELILTKNSVGDRGARQLCDAFNNNCTLQLLDLSDNVLGDEGMQPYLEMLKHNHCLREVRLSQTRVSSDLARQIMEAAVLNGQPKELKETVYRLMAGDETMLTIDLSENNRQWPLDNTSMETLTLHLQGKRYVTSLNLSGNAISAGGCQHLAKILMDENCGITELNLSNNPIDDICLGEFFKSFAVNRTLVHLDLRGTNITDVGAEFAATALKKNQTIKEIVLPEDIEGAGVKALRRELLINQQPLSLKDVLLRLQANELMEDIDLSNQKEGVFGDTACKLLCKQLRGNQTVRSLNLSNNHITSASLAVLTEVIEESPALAYVDLSNNEIDDRGAKLLLKCIELVGHLKCVKVNGNPISQEYTERIAELLVMNFSSLKLKKVILQHSRGQILEAALDFNSKSNNYRLNDDEVILLSVVLRDTTEVRALDLGGNNITDRGCIALASVLRVNHSMEALYLDQNPISSEGGEALYYALRINPQLHTLNLDKTQIPESVLEDILSLLHVNQTPLRDRIDMRALPVDAVSDDVQFRCTDYSISQQENIECEALEGCRRTEQLLLI